MGGFYVGSEYIEALTTGTGQVVSYHCKLCECSFTDPTARLSHLNGRRHLLAYKVVVVVAVAAAAAAVVVTD